MTDSNASLGRLRRILLGEAELAPGEWRLRVSLERAAEAFSPAIPEALRISADQLIRQMNRAVPRSLMVTAAELIVGFVTEAQVPEEPDLRWAECALIDGGRSGLYDTQALGLAVEWIADEACRPNGHYSARREIGRGLWLLSKSTRRPVEDLRRELVREAIPEAVVAAGELPWRGPEALLRKVLADRILVVLRRELTRQRRDAQGRNLGLTKLPQLAPKGAQCDSCGSSRAPVERCGRCYLGPFCVEHRWSHPCESLRTGVGALAELPGDEETPNQVSDGDLEAQLAALRAAPLTEREREIVSTLSQAEGWETVTEAAELVGLTRSGLSAHFTNIKKKVGSI